MNKDLLVSLIRKGHDYGLVGAVAPTPVFLLIMRLHGGWQFLRRAKASFLTSTRLTAIIVLLFGPGWISVDGLLTKIFGDNKKEKGTSPVCNLA